MYNCSNCQSELVLVVFLHKGIEYSIYICLSCMLASKVTLVGHVN